jgi:DNA mismatch repair protein MutS2
MHPGTLRALEFDRVVEAVVSLSLTPLGATRLATLRPSSDPGLVQRQLATTTEAVRFLTDHAGFPLRAPAGIDTTLTALAIEGRPLEPVRLAGLVTLLESIEQCTHLVRRAPRDAYPLLHELVTRAANFDHEIGDVRRAIDPSGELFDHASPELRIIRDRLRRQRTRLRGTLESYLRGKDTAKYLQDQVITDRNGRYVLLVRAEHRGAIPGIVHGSSTSGASLFLEPLSTVEINNEIVALAEQEAEEVRRILLALTDAFRRRALELTQTLEAATELDEVQARARFSRMVDGVAPALSENGTLDLRAARHPLLIPAVAARLAAEGPDRPARAADPVPVDLRLSPPTTVLVITGPNTGGKTVALKTAGLLALMAQAGLHVPAAPGSALPVFRTVFADIGDEQSIAANLSTFSWHVSNVAGMDRALVVPALVLLDEVGAGTDPVEGGALGMAVIDHFRDRGALVVATTHYDALKTYASTTPGVASAAFGFTPDTFEPTYRLAYGSPGTSLALEMAARIGLPAAIIEHARRYRSEREAQLAEHLAKVNQELQTLEHERRLVAREREQIAEQEARFHGREDALREREEQLKRRLEARVEDRLREARQAIDGIVDEMKRRAAALMSEAARRTGVGQAPVSTGETGGLRTEARAALEEVGARLRGEAAASDTAPAPAAAAVITGRRAQPGDRVAVGPLGLEGVVQAVYGQEAEVNVRGKRLRASLGDLRPLGPAGVVGTAPARVNVTVQAREGSASELNVIGCTVDEALSRTDKFLDDAVLSEQRTVRVIHGHGTGQLRRAIGEFLQEHPLVARAGAAPPEQGGTGVTVVELKD